VYVTDWLDGKNVPLEAGPFDLQEYIKSVIRFLTVIGPGVNVIGLCQAGPPVLVATASMEHENNPCRPRSVTLMASPMNMQMNPGLISKLSKFLKPEYWAMFGVYKVPSNYKGAGRLVFPGIVQLGNFMSMNLKSHLNAHIQLSKDVYLDNTEAVAAHKKFYNEYFATLDMPAEFCLETLERIFINNELAEGCFTFDSKLVDLGVIIDTPILAMEGANDDMVRPQQCNSAIDMLPNLAAEKKHAYVQQGVGHYGIFNGSIYREQVAPKVKTFIAEASN
jgi:poly(3-hydroxybutyrate) depolymerase